MKEILFSLASALATAVGATLVAWFLARVSSGRLGRTLDQATKIIDFVERYSAGYDHLAKVSEEKRADVEKLMLDAVQAVREDFAAERTLLPEFRKATFSFRNALMLYIPNRTIGWLPFLVFHTMLFFMLYVVLLRIFQGRWGIGDTVALLVAVVVAVLSRLVVWWHL